jgi:selenocysteine-specific elongation factor
VSKFDSKHDANRIKIYTPKQKQGTICRVGDPYRRNDDTKVVRYEVFGTDLFKKETNMKQFVGMHVETAKAGDVGVITSSFGTSGKFRVNFPSGTDAREGEALLLKFKRYAHDPQKLMH